MVKGRNPNDVGVEATIKPLRNGVVRISCVAGSFLGTMVADGEANNVALGVLQAVAHGLHGREVGTT